MDTINGKSLEQLGEMALEGVKLARQMEEAITPDARCVTVIMACCFIIEICRRNMPGTSLKEVTDVLPGYMRVANGLIGKNETEKSQEDE